MSDPIRSVSARDYLWNNQPSDREDFCETVVNRSDNGSVCRNPTTLLGAVVWRDEPAVSTACRCAKPGTVDDFICDDREAWSGRKDLLDVAKRAAWKAIELFFGAGLTKP